VPRQNRVTPFGELIATAARGTLMGNRGCLHDASGRIVRHHVGKRWIHCVLQFKGRRRPVMTPGRYTELFFLDEATALAAVHGVPARAIPRLPAVLDGGAGTGGRQRAAIGGRGGRGAPCRTT
jgi:hypothetical protein